jgi:ribosomal protein S18 acetylase RimI-like enzyme
MFKIRNARPEEFAQVGRLMVEVYSRLEGFPKPEDQPAYYSMLLNVEEITKKPEAELLVATDGNDRIVAAVVYFGDMKYYGSGGTATRELNASGFRLLAVSDEARGLGLGKLLTLECIRKSKDRKHQAVIIHTTMAMQRAWKMYEKIGFKRQADLDFMQGDLPVFGFRYFLNETLL